jgi:uncharacterized protein (TIGR02444 family)
MIDLSSLQLDNPFWQFSVNQWQNKSLQQHLLALQNEQGFRVNILLLAMWLSFEHKTISPYLNDLISQSRSWHEQVVAPIRKARQAIPLALPKKDFPLKMQLQTCELQAEQIEQAILYQACTNITVTTSSNLDSLGFLILNLSASGLSKSDLSLVIRNCLPMHPIEQINERLQAI